jgi:hypothetical protein
LGSLDPELPTPTDDSSGPRVAGLIGGALRPSAHGISCLAVKRVGRWRAAVEHLINTSGVERTGLLLSPCHLEVRTHRGIDEGPRTDVGVQVAAHIGRADTGWAGLNRPGFRGDS